MKLKFKFDHELLQIKAPERAKDVLIKRYHRQKRYELSLKSIAKPSQLEQPTDEQQKWIDAMMRVAGLTCERCRV